MLMSEDRLEACCCVTRVHARAVDKPPSVNALSCTVRARCLLFSPNSLFLLLQNFPPQQVLHLRSTTRRLVLGLERSCHRKVTGREPSVADTHRAACHRVVTPRRMQFAAKRRV